MFLFLQVEMLPENLIKEARFIKSSSHWKDCPSDKKAEVAFIGRSNVGKSSLINMLTGRNKLAKISGKPGKTRLINHFLIDESWYLVDLPGYGWAKVSKTEKAKWEDMISQYLLNREELSIVFVLVDSRLEPQGSDLDMIRFLGENGVPLGIVFTKSDKKGRSQVDKNVAVFIKELKREWENLPPYFITSSRDGTGKDKLLQYIIDDCL